MSVYQTAKVLCVSVLVCLTFYTGTLLKDTLADDTLLVDCPTAIDGSTSLRGENGVGVKANRLLAYFQRYRYIAPLSRKDAYVEVPNEETCGSFPLFEKYFEQGYEHRSANDEDNIIYQTFFKPHLQTEEDLKNFQGTYVELGAFDGIRESNTRFFDECLGWNGLLIEGNPTKYVELIPNRPFSNRMSMAPSCNDDGSTVQFWVSPFTNAGLKGKALAYENTTAVDVPCSRFTPILADIFEGYESINFLSLDVEGAEHLVLETVDFEVIPRIDILMIEIENMYCQSDDCQVRKQVRTRMHKEGYLRYSGYIMKSDIFIHPNSRFQMPPEGASTLADDPRKSTPQPAYNLSQS
jgi:Methyltransferase FkbM domain